MIQQINSVLIILSFIFFLLSSTFAVADSYQTVNPISDKDSAQKLRETPASLETQDKSRNDPYPKYEDNQINPPRINQNLPVGVDPNNPLGANPNMPPGAGQPPGTGY